MQKRSGAKKGPPAKESPRAKAKQVFSLFRQGDYAAILALGSQQISLESHDALCFNDVAVDLMKYCPVEIKARYLVDYLRLAYTFFAAGQFDSYQSILDETLSVSLEKHDPMAHEAFLGEWYMMAAYQAFPDVKGMLSCYQRAAACLKGKPCAVVSPQEPFAFGSPSMWYLFHRELGQADQTADDLQAMMALYTALTGGHGAGADILYRGELACLRGQVPRADRLAEEAWQAAQAHAQSTVLFGAALLMARLALLQGNANVVPDMQDRIMQIKSICPEIKNSAMGETMENLVQDLLSGMREIIPEDRPIRPYTLKTSVMAPTLAISSYTNFLDMIRLGQYAKAEDGMERVLLLDGRLCGHVVRHYAYIGLALCSQAQDNMTRAAQYLDTALSLSTPDRLFATFLRFRPLFMPVFQLPSFRERHAEAIARINVLDASIVMRSKITLDKRRGMLAKTLTNRELEVARLAAGGMRNAEIAKRLFLSEATVKGYMKAIFQKLNVDRRSKLADYVR